MMHRRTNLNAEQAKKMKLAHEILDVDKNIEISKEYFDITQIMGSMPANAPANITPVSPLPAQPPRPPEHNEQQPQNYMLKRIKEHSDALSLITE